MKNKGITLVELMVVLLITGVILLVMTCQFIVQQTLQARITEQINVLNDASIVMTHMAQTLKFAAGTITTGSDATYSSYITAVDIEGGPGYIPPPGTTVTYGLLKDKITTFVYVQNRDIVHATTLATDISDFPLPASAWDSVNRKLTLKITAKSKHGRSSSLETGFKLPPY